jgi:PAS domain S-box-containing protein
MTEASFKTSSVGDSTSVRTLELFKQQQQSIALHSDRLFARLMLCQWIASVLLALWLAPKTWSGLDSQIHPHVWLALFLGGAITSIPVLLARFHPGETLTRHMIAIGQMLMSALLIHLTGGRIETHFHVFGSLAILAFYRDWPVLISASLVVYVDHLLRGFFWPESVYGVVSAPVWRSLEHAWWVIFEVAFLIISIRKSLSEMALVAERQAKLEAVKETIERTVTERTSELMERTAELTQRTAELTRENLERQEVEKTLKQSQAQLAQAQQIARLGSWEWDLVQDQVSWSEETQRLYGREPGDAGMSMEACMDRIHPEDRLRVRQVMTESLRTHRPFVCIHRVQLPDGTERVLQGRGEVDLNDQAEPVRMFGIVQDVTEATRAEEALHRSEEQLRQSQKMEAVGRLAGGIAHDFNNLLTVISGYCAMSLQKAGDLRLLRKGVQEIERAVERASSLTGQLLAFSRKQVLQPRVLQLNDVVHGMEKMLRRVIGEDIELCTSFESPLWRVKADPGQIEQVILNLAVNARDAMPRGGKLTIQTCNVVLDEKSNFRGRELAIGDYVMLAVSDNGVGMTDEIKKHLFEPFFTTKGVGKGTGLGLATCFGIISQSEGDIRVYSEPGSGTTFKVYLPRTDAPAEPKAHEDTDIPHGTESVLVVEDDPAVRELAASILRDQGYKVQESADAPGALRLMKKHARFDLVISDVVMPQMSGKDLCDQVKKRSPRTRMLLMSGYTDDALVHHGVLDQGLSFLEKPFSPARFARKVREVLDNGTTPEPPRSGR